MAGAPFDAFAFREEIGGGATDCAALRRLVVASDLDPADGARHRASQRWSLRRGPPMTILGLEQPVPAPIIRKDRRRGTGGGSSPRVGAAVALQGFLLDAVSALGRADAPAFGVASGASDFAALGPDFRVRFGAAPVPCAIDELRRRRRASRWRTARRLPQARRPTSKSAPSPSSSKSAPSPPSCVVMVYTTLRPIIYYDHWTRQPLETPSQFGTYVI